MRHPTSRLFAAALAVYLLAGAQARADFISWEYNWTPHTTEILADNPTTGTILLSSGLGGSVVGNAFIRDANIKAVSAVDPSTSATFTDKPYSLSLTILDDASGKSGTLTFSGLLNGILLNGKTLNNTALLLSTPTGPQIQSLRLGGHLYTVQLGSFAPLPPNTIYMFGFPSGSVTGASSVTVRSVPEPSTLALSGLCLVLCGAGWWWKRTRAPLQPVSC